MLLDCGCNYFLLMSFSTHSTCGVVCTVYVWRCHGPEEVPAAFFKALLYKLPVVCTSECMCVHVCVSVRA